MEQSKIKGRWFKLAEAAQTLGVSEITVRRKAKAGQLKAILRNGRYMVYLEENEELGLFTGAIDSEIKFPLPLQNMTAANQHSNSTTAPKTHNQDELIQSLKRTIEDQQTLISSLESSISRLSQKLAVEGYSNR